MHWADKNPIWFKCEMADKISAFHCSCYGKISWITDSLRVIEVQSVLLSIFVQNCHHTTALFRIFSLFSHSLQWLHLIAQPFHMSFTSSSLETSHNIWHHISPVHCVDERGSTGNWIHLHFVILTYNSGEDRIANSFLNTLVVSWTQTYYSHALQTHLLMSDSRKIV